MTPPVWGCPWHGRVQGGELALPNGQRMPWAHHVPASQANAANAGYTLLQRMPGIAPVERTPEEQAADNAAGRQWLHQAIISGTGDAATPAGYLHGRNVGGWIYAAPDGSRWLIRGLARLPWQAGYLRIELPIARFGVLGGAPQEHSIWRLVDNAVIGQPSSAGGSNHYARVEDITPDGSKAIVMLYQTDTSRPRGFVLVTLSGTPGVDLGMQITPLRSAAQTAGTLAIANNMTVDYVDADFVGSETIADHTTPAPECGGYSDQITTYSLSVTAASPFAYGYVNAGGVNQLTLTGKILAMWFDSSGMPVELLLDVVKRCSAASAITGNASGSDILRAYNGGGPSFCELGGYADRIAWSTLTSNYAWSVDYELTATLRCGATTITHSATCAASRDVTRVQTGPDVSGSGGEAWNYALAGRAWGGATVSGQTHAPLKEFSEIDANLGTFWIQIGHTASVNTARWSNNLHGMSAGYGPTTGYPGVGWLELAGISPAGAAGSISESPGTAGRVYGSYNPITGESVIGSTVPVCWT